MLVSMRVPQWHLEAGNLTASEALGCGVGLQEAGVRRRAWDINISMGLQEPQRLQEPQHGFRSPSHAMGPLKKYTQNTMVLRLLADNAGYPQTQRCST